MNNPSGHPKPNATYQLSDADAAIIAGASSSPSQFWKDLAAQSQTNLTYMQALAAYIRMHPG